MRVAGRVVRADQGHGPAAGLDPVSGQVDAGDPPAPATSGANKIDEANSIGETGNPNLNSGTTRTFTIKNMTAGSYALVCNIADHYTKGMRAAFIVT